MFLSVLNEDDRCQVVEAAVMHVYFPPVRAHSKTYVGAVYSNRENRSATQRNDGRNNSKSKLII